MEKIKINSITLDNEQTLPIIDNPKYSLIIAGAGSGKTLTIIGKIKYLLDKRLIKPEQVCVLSFTNEAVKSIARKIEDNCQVKIAAFTFHKLALTILEQAKETYGVINNNYLDYLIDEFFMTKCFNNKNLMNYYFKYYHIIFKNDKKWQEIIDSPKHKKVKELIITFINLFKCNGYSNAIWHMFLKEASKHESNLIYIIYAIYLAYQKEKDSSNKIDFDDMITKATNAINEHNLIIPYKLIIVDEFQDTSLLRFNLIKALLKKVDASLCVVGDDYQSIYHFSGCDLSLFVNFRERFPEAKIYQITSTYRNSQELIDVAGSFIQKNPNQIKKNLKSEIALDKPLTVVYFQNQDLILEKVLKCLPVDEEIYILGRNNFDLKKYTNKLKYQVEDNRIVFDMYPKLKIRYMTIHSAKGLESDNVIVLNMANDIYGFPSLQNDEMILRFVKKGFGYPYEEERRLFYVALTRAKKRVYLLTPVSKPSIFIREIRHNKNVKVVFW